MGDAAEDDIDDGLEDWLLHLAGGCSGDCRYCQEEHWLDEK